MLKFRNRNNAFDFIWNHATKPMVVVLGDDGCFWVLPIGRAEKLVAAGYEYAN